MPHCHRPPFSDVNAVSIELFVLLQTGRMLEGNHTRALFQCSKTSFLLHVQEKAERDRLALETERGTRQTFTGAAPG